MGLGETPGDCQSEKSPSDMNLREYQMDAVEIALRYRGFCLYLEQRTGKTPTAIEIARRRSPSRLLISGPAISRHVWENHLGTALPNCEVKFVTHGQLWAMRKKLARWNPEGFILDESQGIANRKTHQSKAARYISAHMGQDSWRLALSGTPNDKCISESWAQFNFIDPSIFGSWRKFQETYLVMGGYLGKKIVGYENLRDFYRKFHSRVYRKDLDEARGKETVINEYLIRFDLTTSQLTYQTIEDDFMVWIQSNLVTASRAMARSRKLRQLTSGFIRDNDGVDHRVGYEKISHLAALINRLGGQKVVILVCFLADLTLIDQLAQWMGKSTTLISGSNKFSGEFETDLAIVQVRSGVAIDLSAANCAVFYGLDYSYRIYDQARFRIRSYHSDEVSYYYLIANGTIDEELMDCLETKSSFSSRLFSRYREGVELVRKLKGVEIDLSKELSQVVQSIDFIKEHDTMETPTEAKPTSTVKKATPAKKPATPAKKPATPAKKPVAKKAAPAAPKKPTVNKATAKKPVAAATKDAATDMVTLADLATKLKMTPAIIRRKLRNDPKITPPGSRWVWKKDSQELKKVMDSLS